MKEILFLTMEDSAPGFALTGVRQQTLNQDEAWAAIQQACADQEIGCRRHPATGENGSAPLA